MADHRRAQHSRGLSFNVRFFGEDQHGTDVKPNGVLRGLPGAVMWLALIAGAQPESTRVLPRGRQPRWFLDPS
jgi:hypothetical protein